MDISSHCAIFLS